MAARAVTLPDLDLTLSQLQRLADLRPPLPGQVAIEVKLLLELERLMPSVSLPSSLGVAVLRACISILLVLVVNLSNEPIVQLTTVHKTVYCTDSPVPSRLLVSV